MVLNSPAPAHCLPAKHAAHYWGAITIQLKNLSEDKVCGYKKDILWAWIIAAEMFVYIPG